MNILIFNYRTNSPTNKTASLMHAKHTITYLFIQPSSWRWTV